MVSREEGVRFDDTRGWPATNEHNTTPKWRLLSYSVINSFFFPHQPLDSRSTTGLLRECTRQVLQDWHRTRFELPRRIDHDESAALHFQRRRLACDRKLSCQRRGWIQRPHRVEEFVEPRPGGHRKPDCEYAAAQAFESRLDRARDQRELVLRFIRWIDEHEGTTFQRRQHGSNAGISIRFVYRHTGQSGELSSQGRTIRSVFLA